MADQIARIFRFPDKNVTKPVRRGAVASLVLLNVPPMLIDDIREWARRRQLAMDEAAIELLRMAVDATLPPYEPHGEHRVEKDH